MKKFYLVLLVAFLNTGSNKAISLDISFLCDNKVSLLSSDNKNFQFQIKSSLSFEGTLYKIVDGNYEKVSSQIGNGNTTLTFSSINNETVYKLVVVFNTDQQLCKTRQLTGLKL